MNIKVTCVSGRGASLNQAGCFQLHEWRRDEQATQVDLSRGDRTGGGARMVRKSNPR